MASLAGKCCVITGATSGIGLATAERLVETGARAWMDGAVDQHRRRGVDTCDEAVGPQRDVEDIVVSQDTDPDHLRLVG